MKDKPVGEETSMSVAQAVLAADIDHAASVVQEVGEMIGTVAFAASGALLAVRRNLDIVGIVFLAVSTALGGGVIRDIMVGNTPPTAFTDLKFLAAAAATGLIIFFWHPPPRLTRWPLDVTDAIGLGMFVVVGATVGHAWGASPTVAALLGFTTGVGGGIIRDVLSGKVPAILRTDEPLYAIPAFAGAVVASTLMAFDWYRGWMGLICALLVIVARLASLKYGWRGPRPYYVSRGE
ncbi:trimeric intracellular cation channel family protein [Gordonia sp. HY002]|uniref:trimeric intracellular cation channel family protein n=1 Tax=Gordonia zhenghanii TaxID=2911516 RepID=UPI001EF03198|nr:trimeric intracellular cation channel family protein [Gordonia zhenghanii]MCF8568725.1 trimeric intracellular cation channel family protein [Gordonia zhenghanii]MCF8607291.1 trimeric intracellular cation channel family protein [Gordonia zhenghanii]